MIYFIITLKMIELFILRNHYYFKIITINWYYKQKL